MSDKVLRWLTAVPLTEPAKPPTPKPLPEGREERPALGTAYCQPQTPSATWADMRKRWGPSRGPGNAG